MGLGSRVQGLIASQSQWIPTGVWALVVQHTVLVSAVQNIGRVPVRHICAYVCTYTTALFFVHVLVCVSLSLCVCVCGGSGEMESRVIGLGSGLGWQVRFGVYGFAWEHG